MFFVVAVDTVDSVISALFERKDGSLAPSFGVGGLLGMRSFRVPVRASLLSPAAAILNCGYSVEEVVKLLCCYV